METSSVRGRLGSLLACALLWGCSGSSGSPTEIATDAGGDVTTTDTEADASDAGADTTVDADADADAAETCPEGQLSCGSGCVDPKTDVANCGGCGRTCAPASATGTCVDGACAIDVCNAGRVDCDKDPTTGCEADLDVDPKNCGACGTTCKTGESCSKGACGVFCPTGKANCDGDATNGCETDLDTLTDCAFCGDKCARNNATAACSASVCKLKTCDTGFADCDAKDANGCEVNTNTDVDHCGGCGKKCAVGPHATAKCATATCSLSCDAGWADCDGKPENGCEVQIEADPSNCGACGSVCSAPNATAGCAAGKCTIASCATAYADCNESALDGCEVNTLTDPAHCGVCGGACTVSNGVGACVMGGCVVGSCNTGYADCDAEYGDGCEISTDTDKDNCGTCGAACSLPNATAICAAGACAIASCTAGFADCNGKPADGCEVNIASDPGNCGGCANTCVVANGSAGCAAGSCTVASCAPGFADCNGKPADGCEVNTTTDVANCGGCGNYCALTCGAGAIATTCSAGSCKIVACAAGKFDIDGSCGNGCECTSSPTGSICAFSTSLGTLNIGQTVSYTGNLVPAGNHAYLSVAFNGNTQTAYHPRVSLTTGSAEFAFDILTSCAGAGLACGLEGGTSMARTDWEVFYSAGDPFNPPKFNPVPAVGTVIIHVFRRPGKGVTCSNYTLTVSN